VGAEQEKSDGQEFLQGKIPYFGEAWRWAGSKAAYPYMDDYPSSRVNPLQTCSYSGVSAHFAPLHLAKLLH
jgi:hypothetical protein